jgi:hypothetical protein
VHHDEGTDYQRLFILPQGNLSRGDVSVRDNEHVTVAARQALQTAPRADVEANECPLLTQSRHLNAAI